MTKQLTLIRDLLLHMSSIGAEINEDVLVNVRDFAEFVFQWICNAKVYSVADVRIMCELYRDWFIETGDILYYLRGHAIEANTLQEMHNAVYKFDYGRHMDLADIMARDSEQFIVKFRNQQPTFRGYGRDRSC